MQWPWFLQCSIILGLCISPLTDDFVQNNQIWNWIVILLRLRNKSLQVQYRISSNEFGASCPWPTLRLFLYGRFSSYRRINFILNLLSLLEFLVEIIISLRIWCSWLLIVLSSNWIVILNLRFGLCWTYLLGFFSLGCKLFRSLINLRPK